jgi:two-component system response regulator (stage 0 sporulation protein F)
MIWPLPDDVFLGPTSFTGPEIEANMGLRILVVDDEFLIRQVVSALLTRRGYEIAQAEDGIEALELTKQLEFDLVITDMIMPGMDGCELIRRLRDREYPTRYLLISA